MCCGGDWSSGSRRQCVSPPPPPPLKLLKLLWAGLDYRAEISTDSTGRQKETVSGDKGKERVFPTAPGARASTTQVLSPDERRGGSDPCSACVSLEECWHGASGSRHRYWRRRRG